MKKAFKKRQSQRAYSAYQPGVLVLILFFLFSSCGGLKKWRKPDADGDGVADTMSKCPAVPPGVAVDANGCPLDGDGDGVPDYLDRCPNTPGTAGNEGCPEVKDADGDGEADIMDSSPPERGESTPDKRLLHLESSSELSKALNKGYFTKDSFTNTMAGSSGQSGNCFEKGSAVYNTPRKMVKGQLYNVVLSLVAGVVDSLQPRSKGTVPRQQLPSTRITAHHLIIDSYLGVPVIPNERNITLEQIKITPFMSVDLRSDTSYFRVTPEEPQIFLDVRNDTIRQCVWRVEPIKAGERLPLNFIIKGSCDDISLKNSKPFYKTIEISVTEAPMPVPDLITYFLEWLRKNLVALVAILTALSALYVWLKQGRTGEITPVSKLDEG